MSRLRFITDEDFDVAASTLFESIAKANADGRSRVEKNVRDPFLLMALAAVLEADPEEIDGWDVARSVLQAASSAVGKFHQAMLGAMPGWANHDGLVDVVNEDARLAAEVKNKHNTMNTDNQHQVVGNVRSYLRSRRWGAAGRGYVVKILPKAPGLPPQELDDRIWEVDGRTFYGLASGEEDALDQVFEQLAERLPQLRGDAALPPEVAQSYSSLFRQVHVRGM